MMPGFMILMRDGLPCIGHRQLPQLAAIGFGQRLQAKADAEDRQTALARGLDGRGAVEILRCARTRATAPPGRASIRSKTSAGTGERTVVTVAPVWRK